MAVAQWRPTRATRQCLCVRASRAVINPVPPMNIRATLLAVIIVGVLAAVLWKPVVDPLLHRETYRGEVRSLYDTVQLGMTKEQVRHEMGSGKYGHLDFHREGQLWLGSAPYEFGAGNWVLAVDFQGDRVSSVRVRKGDGLQDFHHPSAAPPDKVRP